METTDRKKMMTVWKHVTVKYKEVNNVNIRPMARPWLNAALSFEKFRMYEPWLIEQMGPEGEKWVRNISGSVILGIFFSEDEMATAFKLRFGI